MIEEVNTLRICRVRVAPNHLRLIASLAYFPGSDRRSLFPVTGTRAQRVSTSVTYLRLIILYIVHALAVGFMRRRRNHMSGNKMYLGQDRSPLFSTGRNESLYRLLYIFTITITPAASRPEQAKCVESENRRCLTSKRIGKLTSDSQPNYADRTEMHNTRALLLARTS